jgi:DNA-binding phage protein
MRQKAFQPATTACDLLRSLDGARASRGVSKAELARQSQVRPETVRRLLTTEAPNPTLGNVLDMLRPLGLGLVITKLPSDIERATRIAGDIVSDWLSFYGAPLYGPSRVDPGTVPDVEEVLADSLKLSRERAVVARALPLAFWKSRERLDLDRLRREAERRGQSCTLAFFLDLTARLSGEALFECEAAKLRVHVPATPVQFFSPTTERERKLAEMRTPEVARKWGFRMNMGMDSFESTFKKGAR